MSGWVVPDPPADLRTLATVTRIAGERWWHVWKYEGRRSPITFNPGFGVGRFHPIVDPAGNGIPTFYAADTPEGALFESVFHDIAEDQPDQQIYRSELSLQILSEVELARDVSLVDLTTLGRHRIRVSRAQLIDPVGRAAYDQTRRWAEYFLRCDPAIDGLIWPSRPWDNGLSIVLFEAADVPVRATGADQPLDVGAGLERVLDLAERAEITVVMP